MLFDGIRVAPTRGGIGLLPVITLAGAGRLVSSAGAARRRNSMTSIAAKPRKMSKDACANVSPRTLKDVSEQSPVA